MKKFYYIIVLIMIYSLSFAQTSKTESVVSIRGTAIKSIGEIKEIWETGSAIYVSYENISRINQFSYMFQVGYINFKENPDYNFEGDDAKFNIIPLQVGGRYYITLQTIRPFLMAMTGINVFSSKYPLKPARDTNKEDMYSGTFVKLNFQVGLGLAVKLFSNLQLEVLANYNSHVLDAPTHYNVTGLEIGAGLNWTLSN